MGFHTQWERNDYLHVWEGYKLYADLEYKIYYFIYYINNTSIVVQNFEKRPPCYNTHTRST